MSYGEATSDREAGFLLRLESLEATFRRCAEGGGKGSEYAYPYAAGQHKAFTFAATWLREELDKYTKGRGPNGLAEPETSGQGAAQGEVEGLPPGGPPRAG